MKEPNKVLAQNNVYHHEIPQTLQICKEQNFPGKGKALEWPWSCHTSLGARGHWVIS